MGIETKLEVVDDDLVRCNTVKIKDVIYTIKYRVVTAYNFQGEPCEWSTEWRELEFDMDATPQRF